MSTEKLLAYRYLPLFRLSFLPLEQRLQILPVRFADLLFKLPQKYFKQNDKSEFSLYKGDKMLYNLFKNYCLKIREKGGPADGTGENIYCH